MSKYTVRRLSPSEYKLWDEFVRQSPQGSVFTLSDWLEASGRKVAIFGCFRGSELVAGLPLTYHVSPPGIRIALHPPLTPYLGILFKNNTGKYVTRISTEKEISSAIASALRREFAVVNFNFHPSVVDLQPFIWEGFSSSVRYTYILNLDDIERVWAEMDESRRRNIRRAEKDGIYVEDGVGFEEMFSLVEKTFQRQRIKAQFRTAAFRYNSVLERKGWCRSFIAKNKDCMPIAGVYIIWDWNRSYYLLGGYDPQHSHHGAVALAMWRAIKFTKEELGLREFDFEGSMIPQVELFFRKFGGRLVPYYSVNFMPLILKVALWVKEELIKGKLIRRLR